MSLLISEDNLPAGWSIDPEGPHYPTGKAPLGGGPSTFDEAEVFIYRPVDGGSAAAYEEILLFWTKSDASKYYPRFELKYFSDRLGETWAIPGPLLEWQPRADTWRLGCTSANIPRCHYTAQYGEYLVALSVDTSAYSSELNLIETLTMQEVRAILATIDEQMAHTPGA